MVEILLVLVSGLFICSDEGGELVLERRGGGKGGDNCFSIDFCLGGGGGGDSCFSGDFCRGGGVGCLLMDFGRGGGVEDRCFSGVF